MKILAAKEILARHLNDTTRLKEKNLDVHELQKFKGELDNSDDNVDLSVEQTSRLIEILINKELFKIFLAIKDYLKTENILTPNNLIKIVNNIDEELHSVDNNEEKAESIKEKIVKEYKDGIAQIRQYLQDNGIFSEENEAAALQNLTHSYRIITTLKALNTAEILNSKNLATVISFCQNSEYTAAAILEILEQLSVWGIFKRNQTNFDTFCQVITQNADFSSSIASILLVLNNTGMLNQTNFDMVCQNVQYAKDISFAFMNDSIEKTESILNSETLNAIYQNPKDAANIVRALKILKSKNILNQEIQTAICQTPQYAATIVEHSFEISSILEQAFEDALKSENILNPEILTAFCQYPQYAEDIVETLKILKTKNILNSEIQTAVCQNPQMIANLKDNNNFITALQTLNTAKILNKMNFDTLCQIAQPANSYIFTRITEILSLLNDAGMLDQTNFNLVCQIQFGQYPTSIVRAFEKALKSESILNSETMTAICQYPQHAEDIVQALKTLKMENILNPETQTAVCQNPQMIANLKDNNNFITALQTLNTAKILNKMNFDNLCQIIQHAGTYYIASILSFLNDQKMLKQISFNMVCQNVQYAENIFFALSSLKSCNILNLEILTAVCQNPLYNKSITNALYDLKTENILDLETQTAVCQNPQYAGNIAKALKILNTENILDPETQTAVCQNPQYAGNIAKALKILNTENILDPETQTAVCQNPQYAGNIVDALKILKTENILDSKNQTAVCQNAEYLHVINAAFKALINAKKLTQPLIDNIFTKPKNALFIAEKNGGKPAGNQIAKDFSQLKFASQHLAQAWRGKNSPFLPTNTELGDFPLEILEKIATHTVTLEANPKDELDPDTAQYIVKQTFYNSSS